MDMICRKQIIFRFNRETAHPVQFDHHMSAAELSTSGRRRQMITRDSTIREGTVRTTTIHHPIHLLDRVAMAAMRLMIASMKGSVTGPSAREPFDELMEKTPAADGVTYEEA